MVLKASVQIRSDTDIGPFGVFQGLQTVNPSHDEMVPQSKCQKGFENGLPAVAVKAVPGVIARVSAVAEAMADSLRNPS